MNTRIQSYMEVPHGTKHVLAKTSYKSHIDNFEVHRCTVLTLSRLLKYTNTRAHTHKPVTMRFKISALQLWLKFDSFLDLALSDSIIH